jgi:hypothetical protein
MIDVQNLRAELVTAFESARTPCDLRARTQSAFENFRESVADALKGANDTAKVQVQQLLNDAETRVNGVDLDYIHVALTEAQAVRGHLREQIIALRQSIYQSGQDAPPAIFVP